MNINVKKLSAIFFTSFVLVATSVSAAENDELFPVNIMPEMLVDKLPDKAALEDSFDTSNEIQTSHPGHCFYDFGWNIYGVFGYWLFCH